MKLDAIQKELQISQGKVEAQAAELSKSAAIKVELEKTLAAHKSELDGALLKIRDLQKDQPAPGTWPPNPLEQQQLGRRVIPPEGGEPSYEEYNRQTGGYEKSRGNVPGVPLLVYLLKNCKGKDPM